jgi:hypothetical protein
MTLINNDFIPSRWPDQNAGDGAGAWINLLFGEEKGGCALKTEGPIIEENFTE